MEMDAISNPLHFSICGKLFGVRIPVYYGAKFTQLMEE
jgi:hypothetical protein